MADAGENSRFNRDYLETELSRLKALMRTLELRIETLEGAGLDASAEKQQLAQADEQLVAVETRRKSLGP